MPGVVHASVAGPFAADEHAEPSAAAVKELLGRAAPSELFAVLRLWVPAVQQNINAVVSAALNRGVSPADRDGMTDMSLLDFACKAGAQGVGNEDEAVKAVELLLARGADPDAASRWTEMRPLHHAAFFGCAKVIAALTRTGGLDINAPCPQFEGGTPLHLAAMCGCERAVHELLKNGADPLARDEYRRTPLECAKLMASSSQPQQDTSEAERADIIAQLSNAQDAYEEGLQEDFLRNLNPGRRPATARAAASAASRSPHTPATRLSPARPASSAPQVTQKSPNLIEQFAKQLKESPSRHLNSVAPELDEIVSGDDFDVGDRVIVGGDKLGIVRYRGPTDFRDGDWVGVQLDEAAGKNNGTVNGVEYFRAKPNHGIFVPPYRVRLVSKGTSASPGKATPGRSPSGRLGSSTTSSPAIRTPGSGTRTNGTLSAPKSSIPRSRAGSARSTPAKSTPTSRRPVSTAEPDMFGVGSRAMANGVIGTVRFIGETEFAEGLWIGLELGEPMGKNNGSVQGVQYFRCHHNCGIFVRPNRVTWRGLNAADLC